MKDQVVLVTGASRGIGAAVAMMAAARGARVVVNYRSKRARAEEVARAIRRAGGVTLAIGADITSRQEVGAMLAEIRRRFGRLDVLVLNASGGMERDQPASYAEAINRDAQLGLLEACLPMFPDTGRVVFVTSHMAHFYGHQSSVAEYEPIAASKHAGEAALRARMAALPHLTLVVVSGDMIEGTITPKLLERKHPGLVEARRRQAGRLPTVDEFAAAIVDAAADPAVQSGATRLVGDYGR
jgi:NAD(P)-dependent dehydrogenase (short-subunit alcohol dehydrogenase family)